MNEKLIIKINQYHAKIIKKWEFCWNERCPAYNPLKLYNCYVDLNFKFCYVDLIVQNKRNVRKMQVFILAVVDFLDFSCTTMAFIRIKSDLIAKSWATRLRFVGNGAASHIGFSQQSNRLRIFYMVWHEYLMWNSI